ncbi:glycosyltransferase family protein [Pedobacter agri]|uniref:hypothetical protein n=1 Tax=Pedobacter agri TaxID=454586 RepID=UPI00292F1210|nr:hypothetical protein [Pedobacter agri]
MLKLNKKDFTTLYNYTKTIASKCLKNDDIDGAIALVEASAIAAYQLNIFYSDADLDNLVVDIGKKISQGANYNFSNSESEKLVLIDTNGSDNHGLTKQYIDAFIANDIEFAYIYEHTDLSRIELILKQLRAYPKATIYTFDKQYSNTEQIVKILSFLSDYKPSSYYMHIMPWDVVATTVCSILRDVLTFNINATDHAFWLGASIIDYSIEFRDYGYTVSLEKRGLRKEQLLMLPYYPPINRTNFAGFPSKVKNGSIKIFSGGSIYKILGEKNFYFKLVKQLLVQNPKAELLFAGTGQNDIIKAFIKESGLSDRIHFIGNRNDILEVFENCDIYLGTYPITGGLMAQFAAFASKPILAYADREMSISFIEGFVCHSEKLDITNHSESDFYSYAKKLCDDRGFRISEGVGLKQALMTKQQFNEEFKFMITNDRAKREGQIEIINYDRFENLYLEVENQYSHATQKLLAYHLKAHTILFPKLFFNAILIKTKQLLNKF